MGLGRGSVCSLSQSQLNGSMCGGLVGSQHERFAAHCFASPSSHRTPNAHDPTLSPPP